MARKTNMKKFSLVLLMVALASQATGAFGFKWKSIPVDGSRTGVTSPMVNNVDKAIGTFDGSTYVAPNGRRFKKNTATARAAKLMLDAQPEMAALKEVVGYAPKRISRRGTENVLGDWFIDIIMEATEKEVGKKVDIGIANNGSIRIDMPQGEIMSYDLLSMFAFKHNLCYVTMSGEQVLELFNSMAGKIQVVGGVKITVKESRVSELLVGGEPLDPEKIYGIASLDFLLNGGDDIYISRYAESHILTDINIYDAVLEYVRKNTANGKMIEKVADNRIVVL